MKRLLGVFLVTSLLAMLMGCSQGLALRVWEPKDGTVLAQSQSSVEIRGDVSDSEATVAVNNLAVDIIPQYRTFSANVDLVAGENIITVVSTLGEETVTKTITVTYRP